MDSVIKTLMSVGARGFLDEDDRFALTRKGWINRKPKGFWKPIAEKLSRRDLENLFRGLVITERELKNWMGGSCAAGIWVFSVYERRFEDTFIELADWALKNRGNSYIPFGGSTSAISYHGWIAERKAKDRRYMEHLGEQQLQQEAKIIREKKHFEANKYRLRNGKVRATLVKEYNGRLSLVAPGERLNLIACSDSPLESVNSKLVNEILVEFPTLDTATKNILLKKIDRRCRGSWGKIKKILSA